ncbi:MAG: trypsin-like serine protease [Ruminococcaceae bacterium]|nr:trypsin-like serine protease [Oscillospiraceae bacterium]
MFENNTNNNNELEPQVENNMQETVREPEQEQPVCEVPQPTEQAAQEQHYPTYEQIVSEPDAPKKKNRTGLKIAAVAVVCALAGSIGGGALVGKIVTDKYTGGEEQTYPEEVVMAEGSLVENAPIAITTNDSGATMSPADIYEQYSNAVVGINCSTATNVFGQVSTTASSGSGFIITPDGYVVTNCHVIEGASIINVLMKDETTYPAEVVGYDEDNDVALLKIEAASLPTVAVGNSDALKVGEQVVAIGNPLGELTHTLTVGYVSSLDREINTDGNPINMLQTDAAINSGNSGGPLFDSNGNVIGITTAKYASGTVEGLGFAVPINDAMEIVYSIQQYGYVKGKPSFGIEIGTLNLSYASYYGMPVGCVVNRVNPDSCAEKAGMLAGDIITKIGDVDVKSVTELSAEMKNYKAGETVEVTVYRQTDYVTLTVTLDEKLPDYMMEDEEPAQQEQQQSQPQQGQQGSGQYGYFNPFSFFFGNSAYSGSRSSERSSGGTAA